MGVYNAYTTYPQIPTGNNPVNIPIARYGSSNDLSDATSVSTITTNSSAIYAPPLVRGLSYADRQQSQKLHLENQFPRTPNHSMASNAYRLVNPAQVQSNMGVLDAEQKKELSQKLARPHRCVKHIKSPNVALSQKETMAYQNQLAQLKSKTCVEKERSTDVNPKLGNATGRIDTSPITPTDQVGSGEGFATDFTVGSNSPENSLELYLKKEEQLQKQQQEEEHEKFRQRYREQLQDQQKKKFELNTNNHLERTQSLQNKEEVTN